MKEIVVLFSGGLDSLACLHWAQGFFDAAKYVMRPMYVDFGQQYANKEIVAAIRLCADQDLLLRVVRARNFLSENVVDAHIPMRNTFLLLMASAMYPNSEGVVFGMLHGESCEDKNPYYVHLMQKLFDSQFGYSIYRHEKRKFEIYTPLASCTKTQVVKWLCDLETVSRTSLNNTIGCYSSRDKNCGGCISCFNRWVARFNAGMSDEVYGDSHPYHWMLYQVAHDATKEKRKGNPLFDWSQIWRKRMWIIESYLAMNKFAKINYQKGLLTAVRDERKR